MRPVPQLRHSRPPVTPIPTTPIVSSSHVWVVPKGVSGLDEGVVEEVEGGGEEQGTGEREGVKARWEG